MGLAGTTGEVFAYWGAMRTVPAPYLQRPRAATGGSSAADVGTPGSSDCLKDVIDMRPVYHRRLDRVQPTSSSLRSLHRAI